MFDKLKTCGTGTNSGTRRSQEVNETVACSVHCYVGGDQACETLLPHQHLSAAVFGGILSCTFFGFHCFSEG